MVNPNFFMLKRYGLASYYQQSKIIAPSNRTIKQFYSFVTGGLVYGSISLCCFTDPTYTRSHVARKSGRNTLLP